MADEKLICPTCKAEIEENMKFCPNCGANVEELKKAEKAQETNRCLKCGKEVPTGTKFCPSCGTNLENGNLVLKTRFCSNCGTEIEVNTVFCPKCGANQNGAAAYAQDENSKPKKTKWIVIGIIVLLVLGGLVTIFDTTGQSPSGSSGAVSTSTSNNVTNNNQNSTNSQTSNQSKSTEPVFYESDDKFFDYMESCISKYKKVHVSLFVDEQNKSLDGTRISYKNDGSEILTLVIGKYSIVAKFYNGDRVFSNGGTIFTLPNERQNVQNYWNMLVVASKLCKDNGFYAMNLKDSIDIFREAEKTFSYVHITKDSNENSIPPNTSRMYLIDDGSLMLGFFEVKERLFIDFDNKRHSGAVAVFNLPSQVTDFENYLEKALDNLR